MDWGGVTDRMGVVKVQGKQFKLSSAAIGVAAVISLGALDVFCGEVSAATPDPQSAGFTAPQASGQTVTSTTPPSTPATSFASPTDTATTPSGFAPAPRP